MVNIARTTPTITPMMNHSIIVLLHGQGWFFSHGSRIFLSAQKREEFIPVSPYGAGWVSGRGGGGGGRSQRQNGGAARALSWTTIGLQTVSCSPCLRRSKAAHR